jgi:hypothetical protein
MEAEALSSSPKSNPVNRLVTALLGLLRLTEVFWTTGSFTIGGAAVVFRTVGVSIAGGFGLDAAQC